MSFRSRRRAVAAAAAISLSAVSTVTALTALTPAGATPSSNHHPASANWHNAAVHKLDPSLRKLVAHPHGAVSVIVTGGRQHEAEVKALGGRVTHDLKLIHGFSAVVPARSLLRLARWSDVAAVTADRRTGVASAITPADATGANVPSVYRQVIGADQLAAQGDNGQGATVALIDTGVTPMPDVANSLVQVQTGPGTSQPCVNFTDEPTCTDNYGHGTFLAGLIAGNGASSNGQYVGAAPGAKILSVKIAGASGASDVTTIIAALQYVVQTKNIFGTRVINLSLGTNGTQSYSLDPLDYAVEQAWRAGIVVDVAASNLGPNPQTIDDPADDPFVITVGAVDDQGTVDTSDDTVPDFSSRGPTAADGLAKPDVTAPGAHLVSLAAPGAAITTNFPPAMAAPYRSGSGTSMSTAVVSGLVADMVSAEPLASPNRIKYQLMAGAKPDASSDPMAVGAGLVNGPAALAAGPGLANQGINFSTGTGSLQGARGTVSVQADDPNNTVISGNITLQLQPWNALQNLFNVVLWTPVSALSSTWHSSSWYSSSWYSSSWYSSTWHSSSWYSSSWYSSTWHSSSWYGGAWYGEWDY